jgi:hypothetical protein
MWPQTRLTDLLQIEHPLILAPMAGIGTAKLAASILVIESFHGNRLYANATAT